MKQCLTGKPSPLLGLSRIHATLLVLDLQGVMEGVRVIVRLFVRIDDDTFAFCEEGGSKIVHGVADDDFQRLADHIRLNDIVSGFQSLDQPEDNGLIGQMSFRRKDTAYCSRKNSGLFSKTFACMTEVLR